jgi:hypothetical protein
MLRLHVSPQNSVNQRPTMALFSLACDIMIFLSSKQTSALFGLFVCGLSPAGRVAPREECDPLTDTLPTEDHRYGSISPLCTFARRSLQARACGRKAGKVNV